MSTTQTETGTSSDLRSPKRRPRSQRRNIVVLRVIDAQGQSRPLPADLRLDLLAVSNDPRKILEALRADRNSIELEYVHPKNQSEPSQAANGSETEWETEE